MRDQRTKREINFQRHSRDGPSGTRASSHEVTSRVRLHASQAAQRGPLSNQWRTCKRHPPRKAKHQRCPCVQASSSRGAPTSSSTSSSRARFRDLQYTRGLGTGTILSLTRSSNLQPTSYLAHSGVEPQPSPQPRLRRGHGSRRTVELDVNRKDKALHLELGENKRVTTRMYVPK